MKFRLLLPLVALVSGVAVLFILREPEAHKSAPSLTRNPSATTNVSNAANSTQARVSPLAEIHVSSNLTVIPVSAAQDLMPPVVQSPKPPPTLPDLDPVSIPAETIMENARSVFRQYAARLGGNPVGTNPEITVALNGQNPRQIQFLNPEDGLRVNSKGELVDSWGTPFFFHQLSANEMEIHSAGPDRTMWTGDDLVIK
jgi:hypothetical protein